MIVGHKKGFEKKTRRLPIDIRKSLGIRLKLFMQDPRHPLLNDHALTGSWRGYRSINITGDWRAIYELVDANIAIFVEVDTHHNLYGT